MVAKRGQMDGDTGTEFANAVELTAVDQFGEKEWRAFFAVVRYVSVKPLTEEKEAQLTQMLIQGEVESVAEILAVGGSELREYTDMPGYWAKMVKDAAQALEDATEDEASQASGAKQLRSVEKSAGRKPSVQLEVDEVSEEVIRTKNRSFGADAQ